MNIIEIVEMPKWFKEEVIKVTANLDINNVIFGIDTTKIKVSLEDGTQRDLEFKDMGGSAGFAPIEKNILINADAILRDKTWTRRGIRWSAAVVMSMIFAIAHETVHVIQLEEDPELVKYAELPIEYEQKANEAALAYLALWLKDNEIPPIETMGYIGNKLLRIYANNLHKFPEVIKTDIQFNGSNIAAELDVIATATHEIEEDELPRLKSHIDEGLIGRKINNKYYLTAYEAFDCK